MVQLALLPAQALCRFESRPNFAFGEAVAELKSAVPTAVWNGRWWQVEGENRLQLLAFVFRRFNPQQISLEVVPAQSRWQLCLT